jgi:hypothetical protein
MPTESQRPGVRSTPAGTIWQQRQDRAWAARSGPVTTTQLPEAERLTRVKRARDLRKYRAEAARARKAGKPGA